MNLQLHFEQKIIKEALKLAEIDLFHSSAKIWQKKQQQKKRHHPLTLDLMYQFRPSTRNSSGKHFHDLFKGVSEPYYL